MQAQSISLMVSNRTVCNARCKFCISRTTPGINQDANRPLKVLELGALRKGLRYAERLGATHAILTGKADPTQEDPYYLRTLVRTCAEHVPLVDMHTNGLLLQSGKAREGFLMDLAAEGLTMVTFSVAHHTPSTNEELMGVPQYAPELVAAALDAGLLVRCSLVLSKPGLSTSHDVWEYAQRVGQWGAHMVVVREIWRPKSYSFDPLYQEVREWNAENWVDLAVVETDWQTLLRDERAYKIRELDPLPWGQKVYAAGSSLDPNHGVNVTFTRCDDAVRGDFLKSIVLKPDGHGYRNWASNADILF